MKWNDEKGFFENGGSMIAKRIAIIIAIMMLLVVPVVALVAYVLFVLSWHWLLKLAVIGFIIVFIIPVVVLATLALKEGCES